MASPAYHLRTNKAVDRILFIEALHLLESASELNRYTYFSFGGPYLEDFRLMHEHFHKMKMVSVELNPEVFKRQKFHKPSGYVALNNETLESYLTTYDANGKKSIFWLDYTGLRLSQFNEFMLLLSKVEPNSVVKITLRVDPKAWKDKANFNRIFANVLPSTDVDVPLLHMPFARLLQEMVQIAAEKSLSAMAGGLLFQPISSFYYKDMAGIFTLTGVVCKPEDQASIRKRFQKWSFANLDLNNDPKIIDVPVLSTKERLHLQKFLPCSGAVLSRALKYEIDGDINQYAAFYRQYPYFIRAAF